jgi:hypothetical protein
VGLRGKWASPIGRKLQAQPRRILSRSSADPTTIGNQTSNGAKYMRRYRQRQLEGKACVTIELDQQDVETLIEAKILDPRQDSHSRDALARAVKNFLRMAR